MEMPHLLGGETTLELAAISAVAENIVLLRYAEDQDELSCTLAGERVRSEGLCFHHCRRRHLLVDDEHSITQVMTKTSEIAAA
jgi:hypothetical protein